MFRAALETGLMRTLMRRADQPAFPVIVAVVTMGATLSITVPFAPLLVGVLLIAPSRWKSIVVPPGCCVWENPQ